MEGSSGPTLFLFFDKRRDSKPKKACVSHPLVGASPELVVSFLLKPINLTPYRRQRGSNLRPQRKSKAHQPLGPTLVTFLLFLSMAVTLVHDQGTRVGFYATSCPTAEAIIQSTVQKHFISDSTIAPGLLRMIFHDCFVHGCDGSVLISGTGTERTALPNLSLRGFDVIDDIKTQLEAACPGIVSCADILALASRDAVVLTGHPTWEVPTGRRDGLVSVASDTKTLPSFQDNVTAQVQKFAAKGLNIVDLVALVGGHTIGTSACRFFSYRLYNYNGTGNPDPTIDASILPELQALCPQGTDSNPTRVALDAGSVGRFDSSYFENLRNGRGVLESDQRLWTDACTASLVQRFSEGTCFTTQFARSMVKMTNIDVKTGTQGEIRRVCSAIN